MESLRGSQDRRERPVTEVKTLVTTEALITEGQDRTGLTRELLLQIVAKSAVVRHLATGPDKDRFVLKGGTLLHHVYNSPRQSVRDADYAYVERSNEMLTTVHLEASLRMEEDSGFYLNLDEAAWSPSDEILEAKNIPFTITGIQMTGERENRLDISVSVRKGERLREPQEELRYTDLLLASDTAFPINGLVLREMCAEKVLGWASRGHLRHVLDLAFVAREFTLQRLDQDVDATNLDRGDTMNLIVEKFGVEGKAPRFTEKGIESLAGVRDAFLTEALAVVERNWENTLAVEIFFLPDELERDDGQSLAVFENVTHYIQDFWVPLLDELGGPRTSARDGSSGRRLPERRARR